MNRVLTCLFILWCFGCAEESVTDPTPREPTQPAMNEMPEPPMAPPPAMGQVPDAPEPEMATPPPAAEEMAAGWGPARDVDLTHPPVIVEPGRARRRMNLDQLESAFIQTSRGLNWTEMQGGREVSLFQSLSVTLGKPDYVQTTTEVLEPTTLFQKFLDDAARQVCGKMVARDLERPSEALLMSWSEDSEAVNAHLQMLVLHFHQRDLADDSPDLAQWRWLYDSLLFMTEAPAERWSAVCVALFTHPDFYTY